MNFYHRLAPALIGVSIALVRSQIAVAISASEVSKIAKEVTVLIQSQSKQPKYGSGVIIKREGNTYTVLTAAHVVEVADKYEIVTSDNQRYSLNYSTKKKLPEVDLAIVQFTSNRNYTVAKMGNSDTSTEGTTAYVTGYPEPTFAIDKSVYNFTTGQITANASKALREGYALVYSNNTSEGMSGGAVMNEKAELVGIHGRTDKDPKQTKTGFNLGIPINTFLRLSATSGVNVGVSAPNTQVVTKPLASDFYIQGGDKYLKGDFKGAIGDYTEALHLNPNYAEAYLDRGRTRYESGDKQGAISDFNQALRINPNLAIAYNNRGITSYESGDKQGAIADYNQALRINPNLALAYVNRGNARDDLGDKQGAFADFNMALRINPNYAYAYYHRGITRSTLGDKQGAIADFDSALRINSNYAPLYFKRGVARDDLGDKQGAIADFNQALRINPKYALAYVSRGNVRDDLGDKQGAIADYKTALQIDPNNAYAYYNRGVTRFRLGDKQGAIADYNSALRINPNYAQAYNNRGIIRSELGDKQGGIADLQKAADLYRQQGKTENYQKVQELIRKFQQ
ncbi:serine protease [Iningainema tapete]|uniref:Tetratricopeptide repeat protein n=1 Tax=Iningainema tapete BLCC-T55 TaxID=2748662 RepID=A0A8J7CG22_9CYAN|nr:serine protease [Iningainema tapete]MBD2775755.1 tetratricopeptide repeat protein [Iningainema tapete BLCC-T55]